MPRVVISGVGACSPLGNWSGFKQGIRDGRSGVRRVPAFHELQKKSQIAGCVDSGLLTALLTQKKLRHRSRASLLAIAAASEAVSDSNLNPEAFTDQESMETCVFVGSGGAGIDIIEKEYEVFFAKKEKKISPFSIPASLVGMVSSDVSIHFGLCGLSQVVTTGCTSSTDALGQAFRLLKTGIVRRALVGGADSCVTPGIITGFDRMGIVSGGYNATPEKASRPFSLDRDGFVLGEGAWFLVLEREQDAKGRRAKIRAEVLGYGANCEAGHRVRMKEDGVWPARAMEEALREGAISPESVSYVSLHGTGTKLNDRVETTALKRVFGKNPPPGSAPKSMLGHPQGASGVMGVAATLAGMEEGFLPPTINLDQPDPQCDLDYIAHKAREGKIDIAVCNCIGFGSRNSALVISTYNG